LTASKDNGIKRIRVGIIGANPDRGWAAQGHIPALKSLPDDFEITALSTSRRESADAASKLFGVPLAFDNHQDLVNSAAVDVVAVTVKVPHHLELAAAALEAGKAVYCEWPLGNGSKEAQTLAALAKKKDVLAVVGLQARSAPSVAYVHELIEQGYVGEILSTTLIGSGMGWGPTVDPFNAYLNDKRNGATLLSVPFGHTADALSYCLGEISELSATMTSRRKSFMIAGTGETKPMNVDDQIGVTGLLEGGAAFAFHYRGGVSRGTNLLWEINGTEGDIQLTAAGGHAQIFEMTIRGGKGAQSALEILPVPEKYQWAPPQGPSTNVAQAYARFARDYREGTHFCPTFDYAVKRHPMLDAIETAAATGQRQSLGCSDGEVEDARYGSKDRSVHVALDPRQGTIVVDQSWPLPTN
jgi:predicted dehydrogenase